MKIDKGIPMPNPRSELKSILTTLKIGESFLYPIAKRASVLPCAQRYRVRVATRKVSATEVRIWRIE